ncbi:kelch-like protein 12 [Symsagittifera roscoffensis]|uniref:kelch-like protein 12 n=1 Tax=Symsagittifera roscoffensis TaxID=84072 RepID=UPI00307BF34D
MVIKMELCHFISDHQAKEVVRSMNQLRKLNALCDVELVVDFERFPAHRVLLASCSDYFRAMFTNTMCESARTSVPIKNVSPCVMRIILDYVYAESITINADNVQELLPAASLLQLHSIQQACCEFLERQLDSSNCLGIKAFADTHNCTELSQSAEKFICQNFVEVIKHEEFLNLSKEDLEGLIKRENIAIDGSKVSIFEVCDTYAIRSIVIMLEQSKLESRKTLPRLSLKEYMVIVGGFGLNQQPIDVVEQFESKNNEWSLLPPLPTRRRYVSATQLGGQIYVIGGYDNANRLSSVSVLDCRVMQWKTVANMNVRRGLAGVVSYRDKIYVAGGFDGSSRLSSMEVYDPNLDKWEMMPQMTIGREGSSLVVCADMIYCIGGYDGMTILRSVNRFDPREGRWITVTPLSVGRSGAGVAVVDDMIYVCGGFDGSQHLSGVECYNPRMDMWSSVANMHNARCYSSTAALEKKLYCAAGYDGATLLNSAERFDPLSNKWSPVAAMSTPRCDAGICVYQRY